MRTSNYFFTVEMENGTPVNDGDRVKTLREFIHAMNQAGTKKQYVKLQGRGHRRGMYNQSLPLKYATSADVYVYERYSY